mmetsp:Transcript_9923/g.41654  ORF Transcript_9923/g.41654 Transcript_9923/m.41654 type:complete len:290 (-) Transcript_9923:716-1585(-)
MRWSTWCCPEASRWLTSGLPFTWSCRTRHENSRGSTNASTLTNATGKTAATISPARDEDFFLPRRVSPPAITDRLTRAMAVAAAVEKESKAPIPAPSKMHSGRSATNQPPVTRDSPETPPPPLFTRFAAWNSPRSPLRAVCTIRLVMCAPATTSWLKKLDTKHCSTRCASTSQRAARSSTTKSTPPMGELNAALIPLATPHVTRCVSRCLTSPPLSTPKCSMESTTCDATIAPMCTIGPSRPTGAPAAMTRHTPNAFTTKVCSENAPFTSHPLRNAFVSGMPVLAACGA